MFGSGSRDTVRRALGGAAPSSTTPVKTGWCYVSTERFRRLVSAWCFMRFALTYQRALYFNEWLRCSHIQTVRALIQALCPMTPMCLRLYSSVAASGCSYSWCNKRDRRFPLCHRQPAVTGVCSNNCHQRPHVSQHSSWSCHHTAISPRRSAQRCIVRNCWFWCYWCVHCMFCDLASRD